VAPAKAPVPPVIANGTTFTWACGSNRTGTEGPVETETWKGRLTLPG
jgi:hypothetical protein